MTIQNLDALFHPKAIAVVGASNEPGSVGQVLARNLLESGFTGPVMPVNPHAPAVRSALAYPDIAALPIVPDLAVIATPADTVPGIIADLGARGCRAAVVISAGFEGQEPQDAARRQALLDAARPHLLRIVGPNVLGFISPGLGLNASFAHLTPKAGGLALVTQSGAIAAAALDWAQPRGIGFSHVVSTGDALDVDFGDLLDYLALDPQTRAILLYVESIGDARKFMSASRAAARLKPVVVIKAGRSAAGAKAAFSHTGALAGADAVYDAAFRRAGMLRVAELRELFDAVSILDAGLRLEGDRLAILTNGGGAGVLAVDALEARGGRLAVLAPATLAAIDKTARVGWSRRNPADILGDARPEAYGAALDALLADEGVDAVLVMNCPTAVASSSQAAAAVIRSAQAAVHRKPVITCWLGEFVAQPARQALSAAGLPAHETPDEAVRAFAHLAEHRRNQELLIQTPPAAPAIPDAQGARAIIDGILAADRTTLTDPESRALLKAYGIPIVESRTVATPDAAAEAATRIGGAVALKILSPDISHKTEVGGVALGLAGPEAVRAAALSMMARITRAMPKARLEGFVLEPMVDRDAGEELIAGIVQDPTFGPVVLFGQGGVATEIINDKSLGLPPLNDLLAKDMIARTQVSRRLAGYRNRPTADLDAIAAVLSRLAQMATDLPEIAELDINPLVAGAGTVIALDARISLRPGATPRTAILPYPAHLTQVVAWGGRRLTLRPIRPEDAPALAVMAGRCSPEDLRLRFLGPIAQVSPQLAARLSQIDYDRQMAFIAVDSAGDILAAAHLASDPQGETAEYGLIVRSDLSDQGLGRLMLQKLLDYAAARGLKEVWGELLRENRRMLQMCDAFGFSNRPAADLSRLQVVKRLPDQPLPAPVSGRP